MEEFELSPSERELLAQVLGSYLATLDAEISHTDHAGFRAMLKERHAAIQHIAARLEESVPAPA